MQELCEKIQHSGLKRDEEANKNLTSEEALKSIQKLLKQVKVDYHEAQIWLTDFYEEVQAWYRVTSGLDGVGRGCYIVVVERILEDVLLGMRRLFD